MQIKFDWDTFIKLGDEGLDEVLASLDVPA